MRVSKLHNFSNKLPPWLLTSLITYRFNDSDDSPKNVIANLGVIFENLQKKVSFIWNLHNFILNLRNFILNLLKFILNLLNFSLNARSATECSLLMSHWNSTNCTSIRSNNNYTNVPNARKILRHHTPSKTIHMWHMMKI